MTDRPSAFVIMPFAAEFSDIFDDLIRPALEEVGFEVRRADSILDQQNVMRDVVRGIAEARLVIAEISSPNPNVYYELGIAHALQRPTVLLTQSLESLPFDLKAYRAIAYSTHFRQAAELRARLQAVARGLLAGDLAFGNPVADSLEIEQRGSRPETSGSDGPHEASPGFIDSMVAIESAMTSMEELFTGLGDATLAIGDQMARRTEQIEGFDFESVGAAARVRRLMSGAAADLRRYAQDVNGKTGPLTTSVEEISTASWNLASWLSAADVEQRQTLEDMAEGLSTLRDSAAASKRQLQEFRDSVKGIEGATRELDDAARAVRKGLNRVVGVLETIEASSERTLQLIAEKLDSRPE
jgi:hypothetical protein